MTASGTGLVRSEFVAQMEREIDANRDKGDWAAWDPEHGVIIGEIYHHTAKLDCAMSEGSPEKVLEYAADVAVLAMKAAEKFSL